MATWIIELIELIELIERFGYGGIVVLMVVENLFPPIPSELIMPFAGFAAARGSLHPIGVVVAGVAGSVLGTVPWYLLGRRLGRGRLKRLASRHGRWLTVSPADIDRAHRWFERHGLWSVLLGRLVPAVRSVISLPAGFARLPFPAFLLFSTAGSAVWVSSLAAAGYLLETSYERAGSFVELATRFVLGTLMAAYVYRLATFRRTGDRSGV